MFEKLVVIQLGALLFANTHDHGTEWVKWGGIVVSYCDGCCGCSHWRLITH